MKTMKINGREFEVVKKNSRKGQKIINTWRNRDFALRRWNEVYAKPSYTKTLIMMDWEKFFDEIGSDIRLYRGNISTFTIHTKHNGGYFCITKFHNYIVTD